MRRDAGIFDVSHMQVVDVEGAGARAFLRRALANNVDKLKVPGKALYSCMLDRGGRRGRRPHRLLLPRGLVPPGGQRRHRGEGPRLARAPAGRAPASQCTITPRARPRDHRGAGPEARASASGRRSRASRAATETLEPFNAALRRATWMVARTGYTGEDGFEIVLPATEVAAAAGRRCVAAGARPAGLGARDTLRLEAGMNLYGQDMDDQRLAARRGPRLDRGPQERRATSSARRRSKRSGQRSEFLGLCCSTRAACCARTRRCATAAGRGRDHQRHLLAHARQVDRARAPAARHARRATRCTCWCATRRSPRAS